MAAKTPKKSQSSNRAGSAPKHEAASIAASVSGDSKKRGVVIWPEWSDADINAEKWDVAHKTTGKADKKQSPALVAHYYDDPDGKIDLPPSLRVHHWKRPHDFIVDKCPVVVDPDGMNSFDLLTTNDAPHESELIRWVTGQIIALWKQSEQKIPEFGGPIDPNNPNEGDMGHTWRPWEHIYAINKVAKGPNFPAYNSAGKYVVKLYWLGCWRKLIVDDTLPFDENEHLLLPATTMQHELWPMLLSKALIKVASLDYNGGSPSCEFGDFSVIQCLTGWLPETIPLQYGHLHELWELLKAAIPEFKLPEPKSEEPPPERVEPVAGDETHRDSVPGESGKGSEKPEAKNSRDGKKEDKKDKKEDKKDKKGDKDKGKEDKNKEKSVVQEEQPLPEHPEVVVFASYSGPPKYPVRISVLGEMADASERLRQSGLSHLYPHPVLLSQTRSCPLEPPPPPELIPAWKLIRPKKKKMCPSDEPAEPEEVEEKPIQCVEITSPFINYKVSPVPIPTDVHRPKSALTRGQSRLSSRPGTANAAAIEETDENTPLPAPTPPPVQEEAPKVEETEQVVQKETGDKPATKGSAKKGQRTGGSGGKSREATPKEVVKEEGKGAGAGAADKKAVSSGVKRQGSANSNVKERIGSSVKPPQGAQAENKDTKDAKNKEQQQQQGAGAGGGSSGDVNPVDGQPLEEEEMAAPAPPVHDKPEPETRSKNLWMDFEDFCRCFKTLYVYHKPHTYLKNTKYSDLKHLDTQSVVTSGKDKKSAPNTAAVTYGGSSSTKAQLPNSPSHLYPGGSTTDDKAPHYLFVDSLERTEIVVSLSSLSRWPEPPAPSAPSAAAATAPSAPATTAKEERAAKNTARGDRDSKAEVVTESSSVTETPVEPKPAPPAEALQPGLLVAEPYSWKSLVTGQPILRLRSTATRAAVLTLPAGRHVLRCSMTAPLGYHVHLCSATPFVFGDEETVMAKLTEESCRFVDNASQVIASMGKCIGAFSDPVQLPLALEEYYTAHCPYRDDKHASKLYHHKVYLEALYATLKKVLSADPSIYTPDMATAWKAFNNDCTTKNPLGLVYGTPSRPATGVTTSDRGSASKSKGNKRQSISEAHHSEQPDPNAKLEHWKNREITPEELVAAVKVQKFWRGYWVRKMKASRTPGTEDNAKAQELLQKAWAAIEPQAEQLGLMLFRTMFKTDPDLMPKYPFYKDEWNKISYADYQGSHPDQLPNTWFVLFREIFHVEEEMLVVPKLYVPIHTCLLRVVNNDTLEEVPRVFQKVAPYVYKKNKRGYTFVAEARTLDQPLASGRWRLRLIGSLSPLPTPVRPEVNSSFNTKELRDYYVPNEHDTILRYSVKVVEEHQVSLQLATSKTDVYCKLAVLDNGQEVAAAVGKGHVVLPAVIFSKDGENGPNRTPSRTSNRGGMKTVASSQSLNKTKRGNSAKHDGEGRVSRSSSRRSLCSTDDEDEKEAKTVQFLPHKYIIQATVLRNSWPLSESQWTFVQMLKEIEKNELKVSYKERAPSAAQKETKSTGSSKPGKDSKAKGGKGKEKDKGSRPPSQQFDVTKPNWLLRVVSDGSAADDIEVRKDTERADEIRAMKKAWEEAEPGRAAKALQSRLNYLQSHLIKRQQGDTEGEEEKEEAESQAPTTDGAASPSAALEALDSELNLTVEPPPPPEPKEILKPLDITPYCKKSSDVPRLRDVEEVRRQDEAKQAEIQAYRKYREEVEKQRQADRLARNQAKQQQIQLCEMMQAKLDAAREAVFVPREAFRQKFLEAERRRLEEIAAQEAALRADMEKSAPSPKGRKSAKGKKSPGGKKKK